ncbi:thioredoxin [Citrobacter freundii]|uniref:thioredoxin n=1 Tax=Citrobacter freundii TaxID=546 RepID=UPI0018FF2EF3|nr:thioredoxin [Citrobacter freundii]ELJ6213404.1 thioredoxin [Citrobacter freundii]ELR6029857.1 thioredoxin [Citrobacter freundii]MBJ9155801.1 thioredoxin [Citrobacter freundii]MCO5618603.1 thioredoxin [Citrobacter freundii]MCO5627952.1 thioredoxin [Citrobacter freundii]
MSVKSVNKETFSQEVLNNNLPVLVDFWAPWCPPCVSVAPTIEQLSGEHETRLKVVKVNIDENAELASIYGIRSIPSFKVFNKGEIVLEFGGALPKKQIEEKLNDYLTIEK